MNKEQQPLWKQLEHLSNTTFPFEGGQGTSLEDPIVIAAAAQDDYVASEYRFIKCLCGQRGVRYSHLKQELVRQSGKALDVLTIATMDERTGVKNEEKYYFEITKCFEY